ncbi:S16 family serine protease [Sutcliffiella horikoshii]|uniref:S16 family serine protease n=1 Tax=Sutcliffiella horikoshii TaxID=79883 RepID=UPI003CE87B4C
MEKQSVLQTFLGTVLIYFAFLYLYLFDYLTGMDFALLLLLLTVTNIVFIFITLKLKEFRRAFIFSALLTFILFNYEFSTFILDETESIVTFYQPSEEVVPNTGIYVLGVGSAELGKGATLHFYNEADRFENITATNFIRYRSKNNGIFELLHLKENPVEDMRNSVQQYLSDTNPEINEFFYKEGLDGNSAGLALVLSSILHEKKETNNLAIGVTGAINKRGNVKEISLVKEKIQTAARDGHTHVIVPSGNLKEALKVKEDLNLIIEIEGVRNVQEALGVIESWNGLSN